MQHSKLVVLLRALTKKEVFAFQRYLKCLYEKEEVARQVFVYVRKFYPAFQHDKKLDLAYACQEIFAADIAKKGNRKKMLDALSDLHLWLKGFLMAEKVRKESFECQVLWLSIIQERKGLEAEYTRQVTRLYKETKNASQRNSEDAVKHLLAGYVHFEQLTKVRPDKSDVALEQCFSTLKTRGETMQLKVASEIANIRKMTSSDGSLAELPQPAEPEKADTEILLQLYREIYQLVLTEQEIHYDRLKKMLLEHTEVLAPVELHGIFKYLYNFAAGQIRNGKEAIYVPALHQLNIFGLEQGLFTQKGIMSAQGFVNIVNIAAAAGDFKWADSFIEQHKLSVPADMQAPCLNLANALMLFEKERFNDALELVHDTDFKDTHLAIRVRTLVLRCLYELKEDPNDTLIYCERFDDWLDRKPKSAAVAATIEFLRVYKWLLLEKKAKDVLQEYIEKNVRLYFRTWLLAKMAGYKKRF